ncbi:MAG: DUF1761 domain-containing protein [Betaproteobacteria bacterium]|nr:DUF1761 domain-containing protein [Betaproteobacteria bacterium]
MQWVIELNGWAIAAAVAANIVIGFLWYGPLLGSAWMREMGLPYDFKPDATRMQRSLLLMVLSAVVLACAIQVLRPSTWAAGEDAANTFYALLGAGAVWIGFYVPVLLSGVAWENRSWKLFGINAGYHLAALLAAGMILAHWR